MRDLSRGRPETITSSSANQARDQTLLTHPDDFGLSSRPKATSPEADAPRITSFAPTPERQIQLDLPPLSAEPFPSPTESDDRLLVDSGRSVNQLISFAPGDSSATIQLPDISLHQPPDPVRLTQPREHPIVPPISQSSHIHSFTPHNIAATVRDPTLSLPPLSDPLGLTTKTQPLNNQPERRADQLLSFTPGNLGATIQTPAVSMHRLFDEPRPALRCAPPFRQPSAHQDDTIRSFAPPSADTIRLPLLPMQPSSASIGSFGGRSTLDEDGDTKMTGPRVSTGPRSESQVESEVEARQAAAKRRRRSPAKRRSYTPSNPDGSEADDDYDAFNRNDDDDDDDDDDDRMDIEGKF